jgi:hypothetical protein
MWLFGKVPAGEGELSGFFSHEGFLWFAFPRPRGEGGRPVSRV